MHLIATLRRGLMMLAFLSAAGAMAQPLGHAEGGVVQPPIPDSRFPSYVDFEGAWDRPNGNYAIVNGVVSTREAPFFGAGFFRPRMRSWGALVAWNSREPNRYGQEYLLLTLSAGRENYVTNLLHWVGLEHQHTACCGIAGAYGPLNKAVSDTYGRTPSGYDLGVWQFIAGAVYGRCGRQVFVDGVWGKVSTECKDWPTNLSYTTFGAYRERASLAHPYRGGLRDWAVVSGVPSTGELVRMRNGEDPRAIWGARVWGAWHFTTDPASGAQEPDVSGGGHHLTYAARNDSVALPTLVKAR